MPFRLRVLWASRTLYWGGCSRSGLLYSALNGLCRITGSEHTPVTCDDFYLWGVGFDRETIVLDLLGHDCLSESASDSESIAEVTVQGLEPLRNSDYYSLTL